MEEVKIPPHEGDAGGTAALLLSLADNEDNDFGPGDVKTDTDDGLQFRVPKELADLYFAEMGISDDDEEEELDEEDAPAEEAVVAPKRRGRPPKNGTPADGGTEGAGE